MTDAKKTRQRLVDLSVLGLSALTLVGSLTVIADVDGERRAERATTVDTPTTEVDAFTTAAFEPQQAGHVVVAALRRARALARGRARGPERRGAPLTIPK